MFSGSQYVASIGRNQFGFETRATKSFEHVMGVMLGNEIMNHILNQDSDMFRAEQLGDDGQGLSGDFAEEDILDLHREKKHEPHLGIVYRHPHRHYLNDSPNDLLSPYKVVGEDVSKILKKENNQHHISSHH